MTPLKVTAGSYDRVLISKTKQLHEHEMNVFNNESKNKQTEITKLKNLIESKLTDILKSG